MSERRTMAPAHDRRKAQDDFSNSKEKAPYIDSDTGRVVVKLFTGDCHVSTNQNEMLATILGSCVSACIRDPLLEIGGMNHFLLPGDSNISNPLGAARYGVNAMEQLLNSLYKKGAVKKRLEVKVFGGGNVMGHSSRIGSQNATFVRSFLSDEGFEIASGDLEGDLPRRLHYFPDSGKVMLRKLRRKEDLAVVEEEKRYTKRITTKEPEGDVDLF